MEQAQAREPKLQIQKSVQGDITYLRFVGTVDENFDGASFGKGLSGQLVISLAEVRRITSFGIRQWMEFINRAGQSTSIIYFVECAPRIVDQLNMVANFTGKGLIISFYAPFRCGQCGEETLKLIQVDQYRDSIAAHRLEGDQCANDGSPLFFDDDPESFLSYLATQPAFEVDPKVATFLAGRTRYTMPDGLRKARVEKKVQDRFTIIAISGDVSEDLPVQKLAEGLEGDIIFDLAAVGRMTEVGSRRWRLLLSSIAASTERIILVGMPASMLETLSRDEDLAEKGQVLTLYLPFACKSCVVTSMLEVDVSLHHERLRTGTAPEMVCPDCGQPVACVATPEMLAHLAELPQPAGDLKTSKILEWARAPSKPAPEPAATAMAPRPTAVAAPRAGWPVIAVLGLLVVVGLSLAIYFGLQRPPGQVRDPLETTAKLVEASHPRPPAWRDQVFTVRGDQILVTGNSGFVVDKEEGFRSARAVCLEALCHQVATSIRDAAWLEHVGESFQAFRAKALGDFEKALLTGDQEAVQRSRSRVMQGSERVSKALIENEGSLIQPDRMDFYWEKMNTKEGIRYRVWSLVRLRKDDFRSLVERYGQREEALAATAVSMFPGMAWRYGSGLGAVVLGLKPDSPLRYVGVLPGDILVGAQDRTIRDARSFRRVLTEEHADLQRNGGTMLLKIQRGEGPVVEHRLRVARQQVDIARPKVGGQKGTRPAGNGKKLPPANIWDDNPYE